jgi:mannose-6-phosphate isomerase
LSEFFGGTILEIGRLQGVCHTNSWGKEASNSLIRIFKTSHLDIPEEGPLAELWFGTHSKGSATIVKNDGKRDSFQKFLTAHSNTSELPYLAKILSVENILSIQIHPDAENARRLHGEDPVNYPDANPKPEMAIALSPSSLLCGVRSVNEIKELLKSHPGFLSLGLATRVDAPSDITLLMREVLSLTEDQLEVFYTKSILHPSSTYDTILLSAFHYLGRLDPGMPLFYLLEYHDLNAGEAVFIAPRVPHAYVSGDLFECMKSSDNVVRGGLTPKHIDVEVFCDLVSTEPYTPFLKGVNEEGGLLTFSPPECPFNISHGNSRGHTSYDLSHETSTVMIFCLDGKGVLDSSQLNQEINKGEVYFISDFEGSLEITGNDIDIFFVLEKK